MRQIHPKRAISDKVTRLAIHGLTQEQIAKHVGVSRDTLRKWYSRELNFGLENAIAEAVGALQTLIKEGNLGAICFFLKTRAGWRERSALDQAITEKKVAIFSVDLQGNPTVKVDMRDTTKMIDDDAVDGDEENEDE